MWHCITNAGHFSYFPRARIHINQSKPSSPIWLINGMLDDRIWVQTPLLTSSFQCLQNSSSSLFFIVPSSTSWLLSRSTSTTTPLWCSKPTLWFEVSSSLVDCDLDLCGVLSLASCKRWVYMCPMARLQWYHMNISVYKPREQWQSSAFRYLWWMTPTDWYNRISNHQSHTHCEIVWHHQDVVFHLQTMEWSGSI